MNSATNWDINIHLSFAGSALLRADVSISDTKGSVAKVTLEHPLLSLYKYLQSLPKYSSKSIESLIHNTEEINEHKIAPVIEAEKPVKLLFSPHEHKLDDLLKQVEEGLSAYEPVTCDEGVNGTYFLKNKSGKYVAVFKPEDEEAHSANNKKSSPEKEDKLESLKFLRPGEASKREVAAYVLDREGFFGVPRTTLVSINHPKFGGSKVGSLQEFVESDGPSWDVGPSFFPTKEVHKIGLLDLYLFNFDRHGGNMLFKEEDGSLIPIDNGFALPDDVAVPNLWFEWLNFPQSKKPFDAETLAFIDRLDPDRDISMLKNELGIRDECLRVMKFSATLLKKAAASGLTLYDIGRLVCRADPSEPSEVEIVFQNAMSNATGEPAFLELCNAEMSAIIAKKAKL